MNKVVTERKNHKPYNLPNTIYFFWNTGFNRSPRLVQECFISWKRLNPSWDVVFIDDKNVNNYVDMGRHNNLIGKITIQEYADILRMELLNQNGGVWVDATLFCTKPLDSWINKKINKNDLIVEKNPDSRVMTNSFMGSLKDNYLLIKMIDELTQHYQRDDGKHLKFRDNFLKFKIYKLTKNIFGRHRITSLIFMTPVLKKWLSITPYFYTMYLWYYLSIFDKKFRILWSETKTIPNLYIWVNKNEMYRPVPEEKILQLMLHPPPYIKLNWKVRVTLSSTRNYTQVLYCLNKQK